MHDVLHETSFLPFAPFISSINPYCFVPWGKIGENMKIWSSDIKLKNGKNNSCCAHVFLRNRNTKHIQVLKLFKARIFPIRYDDAIAY